MFTLLHIYIASQSDGFMI